MDNGELPKYPSFSLSTAEVRYPVDLPDGLDELHACPHCSSNGYAVDDHLDLAAQEFDAIDLADGSADDEEVSPPPAVMAITFVATNEDNLTARDIFQSLISPASRPGQQSCLAIPQDLAVEVFKMMKEYISFKAQKPRRRSHSLSLVETDVLNKARPLRRSRSFS